MLLTAMLLSAASAWAQQLPPPSRTVYKCEAGGKTHYSDSPCLGAKKIEVEPTRGLDRSSGRRRQGADFQREHAREAFATAVKPLTGMDARQLDRAGRRMQLAPDAQKACRRLDLEIPRLEVAEIEQLRLQGEKLKALQAQLLAARRQFRELRCD